LSLSAVVVGSGDNGHCLITVPHQD